MSSSNQRNLRERVILLAAEMVSEEIHRLPMEGTFEERWNGMHALFRDCIHRAYDQLTDNTPTSSPPPPSPASAVRPETPQTRTPSPLSSVSSVHSDIPSPTILESTPSIKEPAPLFSENKMRYIQENMDINVREMMHAWEDKGLTTLSADLMVDWYCKDIWNIKRNTSDFLKKDINVDDLGLKELQSKDGVTKVFLPGRVYFVKALPETNLKFFNFMFPPPGPQLQQQYEDLDFPLHRNIHDVRVRVVYLHGIQDLISQGRDPEAVEFHQLL